MNPLLTTLEIISALSRTDSTAAELQSQFDLSVATLKRHLAEARHLGAKIESVKLGNVSTYTLRNGPEVSTRLDRWLELERSRDLIEP
jgi:predicted DNA-binding transcriptional regulator YafY